MSIDAPDTPGLRPAGGPSALDRFRSDLAPVLAEIAHGAVQRELDGELPAEPVRRLKELGLGAVRVPVEHGGRGAGLVDLTRLWIDLAAADANLPQIFRGHFALAEDRLWHHVRGEDQSRWFDRFAAGEIAGNAWSEAGGTPIETQRTVLRPDGAGYRLDGEKFYTTGTIFAEWADVYARVDRGDPRADPEFAIAIVDTREPGVTVVDDWDGFGQRGTGSGTTTFHAVPVPAAHVLAFAERFPYQTALYQLNLLATLSGIARAALADTVAAVRGRDRNYSHANAARVRDDPQVLARVGEIASATYAVEAVTLRAAVALQEVHDAARASRAEIAERAETAELETAQAQVVVTDLVLGATAALFDTLGASATARAVALDRHWRNARTVSSHNPRILKARVVGAHAVNGTEPPYAWGIGRTERDR